MKTILIAAISLDGFITRHDQPGSGFTSPEDKRYFQQTVLDFDTLIFGSVNYEQSKDWMQSHLRPEQLKMVLTRSPVRYADQERKNDLEFTSESPTELLKSLAQRDRKKIAILGGGKIYGLFIQENAVDELWLTLEPKIFGSGVKLAAGQLNTQFELFSEEKLNPSTLLLKYRPKS